MYEYYVWKVNKKSFLWHTFNKRNYLQFGREKFTFHPIQMPLHIQN